MLKILLDFVRPKIWLTILLCLCPAVIYLCVFKAIALNVNYVAFDDIIILGIIPGFEDASWLDRWHRLTELFPEHRLVFSRSVILLLYYFFGKINLVWPMIVANICWFGSAYVFYNVFKRQRLSLWYFVPVMWLWFNIQSFENRFWGVSSLCNYGVLLFVLSSVYFATHQPGQYYIALIFGVLATFSYGNGLMVFPVIGLIAWLTGRKKDFVITIIVAVLIAIIYFINFTPTTKNLDISDWDQVRKGFFGYFGFIGSIAAIRVYDDNMVVLTGAVITGFIFIFFLFLLIRKEWFALWSSAWGKTKYNNPAALFSLGIIAFVAITALALVYKRIPLDDFIGMFKGRYRMYSALWSIALYLGLLSVAPRTLNRRLVVVFIPLTIILNLLILHSNFAMAVNNRRIAIVQEFNARYNADWLGIRMFSMDQAHFEKIRSYYQSEDPLAEGWNPKNTSDSVACAKLYKPDIVEKEEDYIVVKFEKAVFPIEKDFSDGAYVILKSSGHTYAAAQNQSTVPLKTTLRRRVYFQNGAYASFHTATIEPGLYKIYLLVRKNGMNTIYCTGKTWKEE